MAHNINHCKQGKSTTGPGTSTAIAIAPATAPAAVIAKTTVRFTEADRKLLRLIQADNLRRGDSYSASDVLREGLKVLASKRKIWHYPLDAATVAEAEAAVAATATGRDPTDHALASGQEACLRGPSSEVPR